MLTKRAPIGFTVIKEETALIRIDKLFYGDNGYCDVRFIDLELGTSASISILQSSEILKKLNEYDVAKVLRQKVELDFGKNSKETGWQTYIYPAVPVMSTYQLDNLKQEYEIDKQEGRQIRYIIGVMLFIAIAMFLAIFVPILFFM